MSKKRYVKLAHSEEGEAIMQFEALLRYGVKTNKTGVPLHECFMLRALRSVQRNEPKMHFASLLKNVAMSNSVFVLSIFSTQKNSATGSAKFR